MGGGGGSKFAPMKPGSFAASLGFTPVTIAKPAAAEGRPEGLGILAAKAAPAKDSLRPTAVDTSSKPSGSSLAGKSPVRSDNDNDDDTPRALRVQKQEAKPELPQLSSSPPPSRAAAAAFADVPAPAGAPAASAAAAGTDFVEDYVEEDWDSEEISGGSSGSKGAKEKQAGADEPSYDTDSETEEEEKVPIMPPNQPP